MFLNLDISDMATTHLPLLIIALSAVLFTSKPCPCSGVFLSIDCGSSKNYTDDINIQWVSDGPYISTGESHTVGVPDSTVTKAMNTLRAFSDPGKKNCYTIKEVQQGEKVLVRASFYFGGGYDAVSNTASPPSFDLLYDGNYWATVYTTFFDVVSYEVIYVVRGNYTSVCVAQTLAEQLPFISALEIRSLDAEMYGHVDFDTALNLTSRLYMSSDLVLASNTIRYPADPYDRIWVPSYFIGATEVKNNALTIDISGAEDKPPASALKEGSEAISTSYSLILFLSSNLRQSTQVPIYLNFYFSEVQRLTSSDKRSMQLMVNGVPYSKPIVPPYGGVVEAYITNITASTNTSITLEPTVDSTLPVLVNAAEIFTVIDNTDQTYFKDVEGLDALRSQFVVLQQWSGDPCLPLLYSWDWVRCEYISGSRRVTALNLSSSYLVGPLPDFSSMDALLTIDLRNNSIEGPVPDFLGGFPKLQALNLADNRFNGTLPKSLSGNKNLSLDVTGNCFAGSNTTCKEATPAPQTPSGGDVSDDDGLVNGVPSSSGASKKTRKMALLVGVTFQLLFSYNVVWMNFLL